MHELIAEEDAFTSTRTMGLKLLAVGGAALITTLACFYLMMFLITHELAQDTDAAVPSFVRPEITEPREEKPLPSRTKPHRRVSSS